MKLWISNLPPDKSDDDVRAFVRKYTQVEIGSMVRIAGDGSRPGVLVEIVDATELMLMGMQRRLDRMYWDLHKLGVQVMTFSEQDQAEP
jgi:hypothetical protein